MNDFPQDEMNDEVVAAEKHTYRVTEAFDMDGEPQEMGDELELTAKDADPYMDHLELVADKKEEDKEEGDDWEEEEEEEEEDEEGDDEKDDDTEEQM